MVPLFFGFLLAMLFDALQRKFSLPQQKKIVHFSSQKGHENFFYSVKKIQQIIVQLFNSVEILVSIIALPLVMVSVGIFYKDAASKIIVTCIGILFCLRIVYIIGLLNLSNKKE
jgi:hypothetical protein